jgi:hypothetical protein
MSAGGLRRAVDVVPFFADLFLVGSFRGVLEKGLVKALTGVKMCVLPQFLTPQTSLLLGVSLTCPYLR